MERYYSIENKPLKICEEVVLAQSIISMYSKFMDKFNPNDYKQIKHPGDIKIPLIKENELGSKNLMIKFNFPRIFVELIKKENDLINEKDEIENEINDINKIEKPELEDRNRLFELNQDLSIKKAEINTITDQINILVTDDENLEIKYKNYIAEKNKIDNVIHPRDIRLN